MILPTAAQLYEVIEGTWPPETCVGLGPWTIRLDKSGSSRVSAATAKGPVGDAAIDQAAEAMRGAGQTPLFMIREGEGPLDESLAAKGYVIKDPVNMYAAPVAALAIDRPPPVSTFEVWPPLAVQAEIWAKGGIGEGRLAVMDRAPGAKTTFLGRSGDSPAGSVFVAEHEGCAMIHALEVDADHRRKGMARHLTQAAAFWAQDQRVQTLSLVTTRANQAANALYSSLGMTLVGQYHYRILSE